MTQPIGLSTPEVLSEARRRRTFAVISHPDAVERVIDDAARSVS